MNATDVRPEVASFVARVREQLSDLTEDEREELTGGLEADLSEQLAEGGQLPDPTQYADELRAAAGLPEPRRRRAVRVPRPPTRRRNHSPRPRPPTPLRGCWWSTTAPSSANFSCPVCPRGGPVVAAPAPPARRWRRWQRNPRR